MCIHSYLYYAGLLWKVMMKSPWQTPENLACLTGWPGMADAWKRRYFGLAHNQDNDLWLCLKYGCDTTLGEKGLSYRPFIPNPVAWSPKNAEDDKMAIVIHWSSVRGFGILRSQVHGEVPGEDGAGW